MRFLPPWIHLCVQAHETRQTLYQVKHGLLSEYLCQLRNL